MTKKKSVETQLESLSEQLEEKLKKQHKEQVFAENANLMFEHNLMAFKNYFPEIYDKFLNYNPSDKFQLLLNENGTANLIDHGTGVPMYSDNPVSQAEAQVEKNIQFPHMGKVDHSQVANLSNDANFIHVDLMKSLGSVYVEAKASLPINEKLDDEMPSLILFGVGLGYHLNLIVQKVSAKYITLIEPNEDYFFASLFVCDWGQFLENIDRNGSFLYLSIGENEGAAFEDFYDRSKNIGVASIAHTWFYQHYPSESINLFIEKFRVNFHRLFSGFGFFDDALIGIAHSIGNLKADFNLLDYSSLTPKDIAEYPVFIVANGPSLDNQLDKIRDLQGRVIIFSCNSASTALVKHGIVPDFHVALERTESTYNFLESFLPENYRNKINLLVTNVMHPKVQELFSWTGFGLKGNEAGTNLIQFCRYTSGMKVGGSFLSYCNPLVGNTALSFASHLGFKSIYLFGVDNGYIDEKHHHSKSSFYYNDAGTTEHEPIKIGSQRELPGNFVDKVLTDELMSVGNSQMERLIDSFKSQNPSYYNCSNGAKINGALPLDPDDIFLTEQRYEKNHVISYLKNNKFVKFDTNLDFDDLLSFSDFRDFSNTLASLLEKKTTNRYEALDVLLGSVRYLYSFKSSIKHGSIFLLMEGEVLYTTALLISLLYNFGNEKEIMPHYDKALAIWIEFIKQAPDYYEKNARVCR